MRWAVAAAAAAFAGESGRMIALERISSYPYQCIAKSVDVQQVATEKKVPLDWITPDGMQVTAAFEEYARPLILDRGDPRVRQRYPAPHPPVIPFSASVFVHLHVL